MATYTRHATSRAPVATCVGVVLVLQLASHPAAAQEPLGFTTDPKATDQHVTLTGSLGGGYDQNVLAETIGVADPRYEESGSYIGGGVGLTYTGRSHRIEGSVSGGTSFRFYQAADQFVAASYNGAGSLSLAIHPRATLRASGLAVFSPYYQAKATDDPLAQRVPFDFGLAPQHVGTYQGQTSLNIKTGLWSSIDLDYGISRSNFVGHELDMDTTTAGARFVRRISQYASIRLGYARQEGRFGSGATESPSTVRVNNIDAGIDFGRGLTINPRTILTFGFGSSAINMEGRTRYEPTGQASLSRRLSQAWALKLEYKRNLSFVDGYRDAFFADTAAVGFLGRLGRRTTLLTQIGYASGMIGSQSGRVDSYSTGTRLQMRARQNLSAYVEGFYYRYRFIGGETPGGPADMNRAVFRAGVETSVPLSRERNPRAAR